jgi:hypothetical protein
MDLSTSWTRIGVGLGLGASVGIALVLAPACDSGDSGRRSSACSSFCQKLEVCDDRSDLSGCEDACLAQKYRSDAYLDTRAQCADLSCNHWAAQVTSDGEDSCRSNCALIDCVEDKLQNITEAAGQTKLCDEVTSKLTTCNNKLDGDAVRDACHNFVVAVSDQFATESRDCVLVQACSEIVRCIDKLADKNDTTVRIFSGSLTGT